MISDHSAFPLHEGAFPGLTKREMFAAMAMQGLRACGDQHCPRDSVTIADLSVSDADALIAELSK